MLKEGLRREKTLAKNLLVEKSCESVAEEVWMVPVAASGPSELLLPSDTGQNRNPLTTVCLEDRTISMRTVITQRKAEDV